MPQINRIRVNNVKYNFGTQFYDDFLMRFSGKNTIYDLANGGGKSVLMLLLMQNMIPNCTLDEKQPIEKLFRSENGCTTIHSLVEWNLSEPFQKNNYKYMLTGFCARKARNEENEEHNAAIEYFNYVIFYRQYNDNDIKNLPLTVPGKKNPDERERITYQGLKNYLRELGKKDMSLEVKIFERKGDYQRFIAEYGIYESEWEIIRGINKTEGHVRTYFETNYKTTRKVVEDLLIEEIIEKSFKNRVNQETSMAETLIEIKDKLLELSRKNDDIHNYDRQEELLEDFINRTAGIQKLYYGQENVERELARIYQTILDEKEKQTEQLEHYQEKKQKLEEGKLQEQKAVDTVQILEKEKAIGRMTEEIEEFESREEELMGKKELLQKQLRDAESMNDYLDYLYYKKEGQRVREGLERSNQDKGVLAQELSELAAEKRSRDEQFLQELAQKISDEERSYQNVQEVCGRMEENKRELEKELAIRSYKSEEYEEFLVKTNSRIADWKNELNLSLVSDIGKEKEGFEQQKKQCEKQFQENRDKLEKIRLKKEEVRREEQELKKRLEELRQKQTEAETKKAQIEDIQERLDKLKKIYQMDKEEKLAERISMLREETAGEIRNLKMALDKDRKYVQALKEGCPVMEEEEENKVLSYIRRFHDTDAVSGSNYLLEKTMPERRTLLEQFPFLPYAIVVKKGFQNVTEDAGLDGILEPEKMIPVMDEAALLRGDFFAYEGITYSMCKKELFYDGDAIQKEITEIQNRSLRHEKELQHKEESLETYVGDAEFAKKYLNEYKTQKIYTERESMELNAQAQKLELEYKQNTDSYEECLAAEKRLQEMQEELRREVDAAGEHAALAEKMILASLEVEETEKQQRENKDLLKAAAKELKNLDGRMEAWAGKEENYQRTIAHLRKQEENLRRQQEIYKIYDKGEDAGLQKYAVLSAEELESRLLGAIDAYEGDNRDFADKKKLLENYELAMDKSLQAIDYKGVSLESIEMAWQQGAGIETPREKLIELQKAVTEAEQEAKQIRKKCAEILSEKNRLEGAVTHGKEAIIQKYGSFGEIQPEISDVQVYVQEKKKRMEELEKEMQNLKSEKEKMQEQMGKYEFMMHDMEQLQNPSVLELYPGEMLDDRSEMMERGKKVLQEVRNLRKNIQERAELFEREKNQLSKTLRLMECTLLADEIEENANMPESGTETQALLDGLTEIKNCLHLEKERIQKSIRDMTKLKENFESQCIQTCMNVRTELEKLPKLSKIVMEDENIPVISLHIPYVNEEEMSKKMSAYIDEIIGQADGLKTEAERVKYIRNQLAWKRLFGVIVTDMNRISLKLYKRERIREQSKYLRYEEAVGSTGQSQGIYIQFLIAVVNYITSLHSRNTDYSALGKVIFIDNPFGAAKDIYIWEPIFKLLKTNRVQLIVPCRGATPAITGKFDANYVLGQRMINGKQQTVVVNYYSQVETEQLEYETVKYTQESFLWNE